MKKRIFVVTFASIVISLSILPNVLGKQMFPFNYYNMYIWRQDVPEVDFFPLFLAKYENEHTESLGSNHSFFYPFSQHYYIQSVVQVAKYKTRTQKHKNAIEDAMKKIIQATLHHHNWNVQQGWRKGPPIHQVTLYARKIRLNQNGKDIFSKPKIRKVLVVDAPKFL